MKVLYSEPNNKIKYKKWYDNNGTYDIWYEDSTMIFDYLNMNLPIELKEFLNMWTDKMQKYMETYIERYPVKLARIEFIYKDVVYSIYPTTIKAIYQSTFMSDEPYDVSWDSLFETYQREIRDDLERILNVKYSRYIGFLD